jgi:polyphosphate kinase
VAPIDLARNCVQLVERETAHARRRRPARIIAKVNALLDKPLIEALYAASRAGVEIDLIVRGACALRPGVKGLSHRIRVRSIIGRFLEHSRVFYFENGGDPEVFLGSADWMPRNLYERVEVMFPVRETALRDRVTEMLGNYLKDTAKSRYLRPDGKYIRAYRADPSRSSRNGHRFSVQRFFIDEPAPALTTPENNTAQADAA